MKKQIMNIVMVFFCSSLASAHCPDSFTHEETKYCFSLAWQQTQQRLSGEELKEGFAMSPYLVPFLRPLIGQARPVVELSRVKIFIWKEGDANHVPVVFSDFRVFPYMFMENSHHHATNSSFSFVEETAQEQGHYLLEGMRLQGMQNTGGGCWQLRWMAQQDPDFTDLTFEASEAFKVVSGYTNLEVGGLKEQESACEELVPALGEDPAVQTHHHHGNH